MIDYPFEKCKKCANPVRIVDIHGKTIGRKCYYQLDTMKEWWDKEDCEHFFEPKNVKTSELGEALQYAKVKRTQCSDEDKEEKMAKNPRTQFEFHSWSHRNMSDVYDWLLANTKLKADTGVVYQVDEVYFITSCQNVLDKVNKRFGSSFSFYSQGDDRQFWLD